MARKTTKTGKGDSVREQAAKSQDKAAKPRKLRTTASQATKPVKKVVEIGKKEVYLPMPKNKAGRFLNKRRHIIPKYFRESWKELKKVTWPDRKQTIQLTFAVFAFAIVFMLFVGIVDYGLDKLFRKVFLS
jgi:preprotein translocase subunit SecE